MPNKRMADDDHPVLFTVFNVAIGGGEIVNARRRMNQSPLENIFGRDGIELCSCEKGAALVCSRKLGIVQRGADQETALEDFFERGLGNRMPGCAKRKNAGQK